MIDLTKIQIFPTPEILNKEIAMLRLQNATITNVNAALTETNKAFRNALIVLGVTAAIVGGYKLYKKYKDDESK